MRVRDHLQPAAGVAGLVAGTLASLGLPGIDLWPMMLAGMLYLDWRTLTAPRTSTVVWLAAGWAIGLFVPFSLGSLTWGAHVAATFGILRSIFFVGARVAWTRGIARRVQHPVHLFALTTAAWALWQILFELLGYPNPMAAHALASVTPLAASVRLLGAALFEGLLTAVSVTAAAQLARDQRARAALTGVAGTVAVLLLSALAGVTAPRAERTLSVGIPQVNVSSVYYQARVLNPFMRGSFETRLRTLLTELDGVDLLVTTESLDGRFHLISPALREAWADRARDGPRALLLASYLPERSGRKSNVVAGFAPNGELVGIHRKVHLAPFGESSLHAGEQSTLLELLPGVRVGPLICLESILRAATRDQVDAGANLLAASTSDITFRSTPLPFLHLAGTRLQALELGRSIVWASNGGPSGPIDRFGRFVEHAPFRQPAAARFDIDLHDDAAPLRWLEPLWLALCLAVLLIGLVRAVRAPSRWRPRPRASERPTTLHASILLGAMALVSAAVIGATPIWVELSSGEATRTLDAVTDLFVELPVPTGNPNDPWADFRSRGSSAPSATSYFLAQYGVYVPAYAIAELEGATSIDDIADTLKREQGIDTIRVAIPTVLATLVQLDDGTFAVALDYDDDGEPLVFSPNLSTPVVMNTDALLRSVTDRMGLLPVLTR